KSKHRLRALLCTNTIAVLTVALGQLLLSLWCIDGSKLISANQFHFFPPIMVHQSGYYMCACSFLLITTERLLLCYRPNFYELHSLNFFPAFFLSLTIE
ncbi:hypothetical protein PMAYCL1PPCAC_17266, partial [Pristionchus mayeri]